MVALSVLLLTKNGARELQELLPALFAQRDVGPFEVIAVDSGSTDGTIELLHRYAIHVRKIPAEQFHHARTRNQAATLAIGKILVFLSQDAVPNSNTWLATLIANFADPRVGAAYGRQIAKPGSHFERQDTFDTIYGTQKLVKDPAHRNGLGYRFYHFSNVNAAVRRDVWEATQFPEDLKVFEDIGIAKRILDAGWKIVYDPDASVIHSHNHTTVSLFKRYFDIGYTLSRLQIWQSPGTRSSLARDAWRLFRKKIQRSRVNNSLELKKSGIDRELMKSAGLLLGLNQAYLPLSLKRRFSAFKVFG